MTECGKKLKLYDVEVKDKNFYFKDPVKLLKNTKLGNDISDKTNDIPATTIQDCQGKGVGKGASSIEIKDGKCGFYDDNTNNENSCGDECYQLKIKNISDYRTENGKEINVDMENSDIKIYKQSDYQCNCDNGGYFKDNVCTKYTTTSQQCSSQKLPFISGTQTTDSKCGDECGSGFYFSSKDNACKQNVKPSTQKLEQIVYNFDTRMTFYSMNLLKLHFLAKRILISSRLKL